MNFSCLAWEGRSPFANEKILLMTSALIEYYRARVRRRESLFLFSKKHVGRVERFIVTSNETLQILEIPGSKC